VCGRKTNCSFVGDKEFTVVVCTIALAATLTLANFIG
jgi:hypothetical protein